MNDVKIIDAAGKSMGRVATLVASILMGKDTVSFSRHKHPATQVHIKNISKLNIPAGKQETKIYSRYSGYQGGLKQESMKHLIGRKGYEEAIRRAIYGMLPANKLRSRMMKKLVIGK